MNPRLIAVSALALLALPLRAAEPVPVTQEPMHRPVFENEYVRIIDVQVQPGARTLFHRHEIPSAVVYLTNSTNHSETWQQDAPLDRTTKTGESRYAPYDVQPLIHRVTNTGSNLFRVYDIELLHQSPVAAPAQADAHLEKQWDEKRARSFRVRLAAGDGVELPAGACAHLFITTSGTVAAAKHELAAPAYQFFPAHTVVSLHATAPAEGVLLELK